MFNLIVIHEPGSDNWRWVRNQLRQLLGSSARYISSYQSVILYSVDGDPHVVAEDIRGKLAVSGTPVIRVIPVDVVVEPYIDKVVEAVKELAVKIPPNDTFRITMQGHIFGYTSEGRRYLMHTLEAIKEIAEYVDRPVNLENPSWVLLIKVVKFMRGRRLASISLLKPEELRRIAV